MAWLHYLFIPLLLCVRIGSSQQNNVTLCQWVEPRVGVIRDTAYIDGGLLTKYGPEGVIQDGNPQGLVYLLNFSTPFNTNQNMSQVFTTISATNGVANNLHLLYIDGAIFANDGEYYTYGGLTQKTDAFAAPDPSQVSGYEAYWYGPPRQFTSGFINGELPTGVTPYVAYGASVSVPSENKGFYFSGMRSLSSGPIYKLSANTSINANTVSNTLISVDLSKQRGEIWSNQSLPSTIQGRASAELVWIPAGKNGTLIAIGGAIDPVYIYPSEHLNDSQAAANQAINPKFMSSVSIYDIETRSWFTQQTTGSPPPGLAQGCTVVASAQDYSSHNIYWYGGFNAVDQTLPFSDDVYILSVPSFMWTKAYIGNTTHGRAGHKCVKPYPDQMFIIGGYPAFSGESLTCVGSNIVQVFNLSSATWMTSYSPSAWSNYSVPDVIVKMIGGTGAGGATTLEPSVWSNQTLKSIFSTQYDATKIKNWYPYALTPTNTTVPVITPVPAPSGGLPSWVAPVLGTVLGLVAISAVLVCILLWRRRQLFKGNGALTATTDMNRNRIMNWVRGADGGKAPTVTTDDMPSSPMDDMESTAGGNGNGAHEMAVNLIHELMDTSLPQELSGTGLTYLPRGGVTALKPSPSAASHGSQSSGVSRISGSSPQQTFPRTPRPDSPSLGSTPGSRIVSGMTETGGRESAHIRQLSLDSEISEASAPQGLGISRPDLAAEGSTSQQQIPEIVTPQDEGTSNGLDHMLSPVSPTTPDAGSGSGLAATLEGNIERAKAKRRSNFGEMLDD